MSVVNEHNDPTANISCMCWQHTTQRWAIRKGSEILPKMLEAKRAHNEDLLDELSAQLEEYNRIAQQPID